MTQLVFAAMAAVMVGFFAGTETGAYQLNRLRLRRRVEEGRADAKRLAWLLRNPQAFVCMTLGGTNISVDIVTALVTAALTPGLGRYAEMVATLALAPVMFLFAEALPKTLFQTHANRLMYWLAWPLWVCWVALWPVTKLLQLVTMVSSRLLGAPAEMSWELSAQRLQDFFIEGAREGVLSAQQTAMAGNVMKIGAIPVKQVMIPLEKTQMAPVNLGMEALRKELVVRPHSRVPVYEGARTNVVGVVNLMDFLCIEGAESVVAALTVADLMRPLPSVRQDMPVDSVLQDLQRKRQAMAAVTDHEGKAVGIVTVKDLAEQVVGGIKGL